MASETEEQLQARKQPNCDAKYFVIDENNASSYEDRIIDTSQNVTI